MPASAGRMTQPYNRSFPGYGSGINAGRHDDLPKGTLPDERHAPGGGGGLLFRGFLFTTCTSAGTEPGEKDGVGQLVMTLLSLAASWRSPRPVEELTRRVQPLLTAPRAGGGLTLVGAIKNLLRSILQASCARKEPRSDGA
jgi:hypothetical protein